MTVEATVGVLPVDNNTIELQSVKIPDPAPTEVVVKLFASGICHSQLHQIHGNRGGPTLLGHEATGKVIAIGGEVSHVEEGDEVMVTWIPRDAAKETTTPPWATLTLADGSVAGCQNVYTWADHSLMDAQYVIKAEGNYDRHNASIIGCAVMTGYGAAIHTAEVKPGQSVVVIGVGGVGLSAVWGAKKAGANPIIAVDLDDTKLALAKQFGATHVINNSDGKANEKIHAMTQTKEQFTFGMQPISGVDFAFDCLGIQQTMQQILACVKPGEFGAAKGGTAVLVGVPTQSLEIQPIDLLINQKSLIGSFGGSCVPQRDLPDLLAYSCKGELDLDALVSQRFKLEEVNEAVAALDAGEISGRAIFVYE